MNVVQIYSKEIKYEIEIGQRMEQSGLVFGLLGYE